VAKRKYRGGPRGNLAARSPVEDESISKALGGLPDIVTFETITVADRSGERFHSTPSHELIHVQQGGAKIQYRKRSFLVGPSDTFIIPRGVKHRDVRQSEGPYRTFYVFFHWDSGDSLLREIDPKRLLAVPDASKGLLHHLMTEFEREYIGKAGASAERLSLMLLEVLLALVRHSRRPGRTISRATSRAAEEQRHRLAAEAKRYLEEHYSKPVGLEEMARRFDVSPFHLSRSFSREFGVSASDMLTMIRMNEAKELLKGSRLSIKEIAARLGYSGGNYFAKVFRRVCGLSPSEYRLLVRKQERH